jgi:hypothetical protein
LHTYQEARIHGCAKKIRYVIDGSCWKCVSHYLCERPNQSYITIHRNAKPIGIHRHVWQLENSQYLKPRECVKQSCGNPACINPAHLVKLSNFGRVGFHRRKLKMEQAEEIRREHREGATQMALAVKYGVCQGTIRNIVHGKTYLRYPPPEEKKSPAQKSSVVKRPRRRSVFGEMTRFRLHRALLSRNRPQ